MEGKVTTSEDLTHDKITLPVGGETNFMTFVDPTLPQEDSFGLSTSPTVHH